MPLTTLAGEPQRRSADSCIEMLGIGLKHWHAEVRIPPCHGASAACWPRPTRSRPAIFRGLTAPTQIPSKGHVHIPHPAQPSSGVRASTQTHQDSSRPASSPLTALTALTGARLGSPHALSLRDSQGLEEAVRLNGSRLTQDPDSSNAMVKLRASSWTKPQGPLASAGNVKDACNEPTALQTCTRLKKPQRKSM